MTNPIPAPIPNPQFPEPRQSRQRPTFHRPARRAVLELHKHKGIPYDPAQVGFVFSKEQIEAHAQRLMRLNESLRFEYVLSHMQPPK